MRFAHIQVLFLVWAVPLLLLVCIYGMRRRRRIMARYATGPGRDAIAPANAASRRWTRAVLCLTALLFGILALAGPRYGYHWERIQRKGVDIVVALDCSRSMLATDVQPSRLERAKRKILDLLDRLDGDRIGLVAFAGTAFLQCPLTLDYSGFHIFLNALSPDYLPVGGTDLAGAIRTSVAAFNPQDNTDKAIILITDGGSTTGDPIAAARKAQKAGIKIFTIGVGAAEGVPIPGAHGGFLKDSSGNIVMSRLDAAPLKKIALLTGGAYVRSVTGDMDLAAIYGRIRKEMHRRLLSSSRKQVWEDRYQWLLIFAIAALAAERFIGAVPRRRRTAAWLLCALLLWPLGAARAESVYQSTRQGAAAYKAGHYQKALKNYIDAQLNAPEKPEIQYDLGNTLYKLGKYDEALSHYDQALSGTKDPGLREKTLYNMGNALFRQKKYKEAVKKYEAALKLDAKDRLARDNLGFVKRVMKEKKPPPKKSNGSTGKKNPSDKNKKNQKSKSENGKKGKHSGKNGASKPSTPKTGKKNGAGAGKKPPEKPGAQGPKPATAAGKNPPAGTPPPATANSAAAQNRAAAERMLNRLQDQPGRAMIPMYGKHPVGEDW